tara:strand:- start:2056 stop:2211 length:156 start_codon:yes stop_codon:yes gene_type:complete
MTKKKIIKFETKKEGKLNTISRIISVKADKKKTKLIPLLTLDYFRRKKDGE